MEVVSQTSFDVEPFVAQLLQTQIRRTGGAVLDYDLRVLEPKLRAVDMRGLGGASAGASVAGAERSPLRYLWSDPDRIDGEGEGAAEQGGVEVTDAELGEGHPHPRVRPNPKSNPNPNFRPDFNYDPLITLSPNLVSTRS